MTRCIRIGLDSRRHGVAVALGLFLACGLFLSPGALFGEPAEPDQTGRARGDWSDLQDNEFKLFGSDKEEKIPLSLKPIAEIEDWRDPQSRERYLSYRFGWLGYWTINVNRYPKFNRTRLLLYSNLESKIDNRRQSWVFPLYYYSRDGDEEKTITPLTYHFFSNREEIGLIGPLYSYRNREETKRFLLPLVYYGENRAANSSYLGIFPLFLHSSREDDKEAERTILTPFLYHNSHQPKDGKGTSFSVSPLHYYSSSPRRMTFGLPIVPLLFFRSEEGDDVHYNMALIFDALWKKDTLERFWAFPLLFYRRGESSYFHVVPPVYVSFRESDFSYTHLIPLYFHMQSPRREIEATPLSYYSSEEGNGVLTEHRNLFWFFDWVTDSKQGLRRFAIIPLLFYGRGPEHYLHVAPPLYVSFGEQNWSYRHFLPFLFQWQSGSEEIDFYWLYSRYADSREVHHNVAGLVDFSVDRAKGLKRLWTIPFFFYEPDRYLHVLPPFYVSLKSERTTYRHLFPLYFHAVDDEREILFAWLYSRGRSAGSTLHNVAGLFNLVTNERGERTHLHFLPFLYSGPDFLHVAPFYFSSSGATESLTFGPIYYYWRERTAGGAYSLLLGPVFTRSVPTEDRRDLHVVPLSFTWTSKNAFTWFFLPALAYISSSRSQTHQETSVYWPLWLYARDVYLEKGTRTGTDTTLFAWIYFGLRQERFSNEQKESPLGLDVSPLYVYRRSQVRLERGVSSSYRLWFPIVPLFYRSHSTEEGTHTNVLYLADWKSDARGQLERFWFIPLAFYERDRYLHILPFFIRPFGADAEKGWSGGPLHYHSWSPTHRRLWLGLYYDASDKTDKSATTVLFPFYYEWDRDGSSGNILLPLRVQYEDKRKLVRIWVFGGSSSQRSGALTANVGRSDRGIWYVDVDYSFAYNLFSFAYRKSIFAPAGTEEPARDTKTPGDAAKTVGGPAEPSLEFFRRVPLDEEVAKRQKVDEAAPRLTKKPDITRETARDFKSITLLFGMFAYQRADTEHHVRLFPLWWFTWDDKYRDRVTVVPPFYVNYEREDVAYTVLFPFYGHQRAGKSTVTAYGMLLYLREYDDDTKETAHSVLWPFFQRYSSPTRDGFRVFPIFWRRNIHEGETRRGSRTVVFPLLYHSHTSTRTPQGWEHSDFRVNPLEYVTREVTADRESELAWRPIVPLYVSRSTGTVIAESTSAPVAEVDRRAWSLFLPVALTRTRQTVRKDRQSDAETVVDSSFQLFGLPLLYYGVSQGSQPNSRSRSFFLLGFYDHVRDGYWSQSFLVGLYRRVKSKEGENSFSLLYGLVRSDDSATSSSFWALPFYYGSRERTDGGGQSSTTAVPVLLTWYSESRSGAPGSKVRATGFYSPFVIHRTEKAEQPADAGPKTVTTESSLTVFPILPLPLLYRSAEGGAVEWDWLKVFHYEHGATGPATWRAFPFLFFEGGEDGYFTIFPVFWSYRNVHRKESALHVLPPLFFSWRRPNEWSMFIAGLYLQSSPESSRQNFLYLIDRRYDRKRDEYEFGMLFDFFRIRGGSRERFELDVGYGLLFGLDAEASDRYDWNFLWMQNEKRPTRFESSFLPFWYFESRKHAAYTRGDKVISGAGTEWTLWLLPLTYIRVDTRPDRGDSWFLLGGIYFRSDTDYSRQNFYFLFDHYRYKNRGEEFWGLLFHSFSYERTRDRRKFALLYRALGGMDYRDAQDYDFNILWYVQYQDGPQFYSIFLPLWYYTSNADSSVLVVPPLLAYASRDRGGIFQLAGLGALWYRNYDAYSLEDNRRILLGAVYEEQSRAERGYQAYGSLWGFLWQYQRENETGYRKFSVLRLPFYRKVRRDGQMRTYILGIPTD